MTPQHHPPTLHLICGLPGAGKTVLAREIAASTGAFRFSPDEWIKDIWGNQAENEGNRFRDQVEKLQWKIAKHAFLWSIDVIVEWGTWGRNEREKLRDEARAAGAKVKFYRLNVPRKILKERLLKRNRDLDSYEFYIPELEIETFLDECFRAFQAPTEEELATYDEVARL